MASIFLAGAGGGGGSGAGAGGGGGGASGGIASLTIPINFLPDVLWITVGAGGAGGSASNGSTGGITFIRSDPDPTAIAFLSTLTVAAGGVSTGAGGVATPIVTPVTTCSWGVFSSIAMPAGAAGGAASNPGASVTWGSGGAMFTGGAGGCGFGGSAGGGVTGAGPFPSIAGITTAAANGFTGINLGLYSCGGGGGMATSGNGGNGGIASGGGGGAGTGGLGGKGGDGIAIIVCY